MDTLGNIFYVGLLGYSHWLMSISITQLNDHYISLDKSIYATSVVSKYLYTSTIKENSNFLKTNLPHDMIFTNKLLPVMNNCNCCIESTTFASELVSDN